MRQIPKVQHKVAAMKQLGAAFPGFVWEHAAGDSVFWGTNAATNFVVEVMFMQHGMHGPEQSTRRRLMIPHVFRPVSADSRKPEHVKPEPGTSVAWGHLPGAPEAFATLSAAIPAIQVALSA